MRCPFCRSSPVCQVSSLYSNRLSASPRLKIRMPNSYAHHAHLFYDTQNVLVTSPALLIIVKLYGRLGQSPNTCLIHFREIMKTRPFCAFNNKNQIRKILMKHIVFSRFFIGKRLRSVSISSTLLVFRCGWRIKTNHWGGREHVIQAAQKKKKKKI